VRQVGYLQGLYRDSRSTEHKIIKYIFIHIQFTVYYNLNISWLKDSVFVQRLATGWTARYSNYGKKIRYFLLFKRTQTRSGIHSLIFNVYWGSFPGVIWPGREAEHIPPSRAEVKNDVAILLLPPIWLRGVDRNKFTLFIFIDIDFMYDMLRINGPLSGASCFL
jgi:hypothetical protein